MGGMPSLSNSSSASASLSQAGSSWDLGFGGGAWSINLGGSGAAQQSAGAMPAWVVPAILALGVLWLATRRGR